MTTYSQRGDSTPLRHVIGSAKTTVSVVHPSDDDAGKATDMLAAAHSKALTTGVSAVTVQDGDDTARWER